MLILSKMIQSKGFLGRLPGPLLKTGLPLIKMYLSHQLKVFQFYQDKQQEHQQQREYIKKILDSRASVLIMSNGEMEDIIKIIKSLEDSGLLL